MFTTHDILMLLTASMPMKTIAINGHPYLERYFVREDENGGQYWLHRFLRNDSERHLHSHPWDATSFILTGWYKEQLSPSIGARGSCFAEHFPGGINDIPKDKLHRIAEVAADTWTYMIVAPRREKEWFFIDDEGNKTAVQSSPADWHKNCKPRK